MMLLLWAFRDMPKPRLAVAAFAGGAMALLCLPRPPSVQPIVVTRQIVPPHIQHALDNPGFFREALNVQPTRWPFYLSHKPHTPYIRR